MMLWDLIRDFFVQHITGGYLSNGTFIPTILGHMSVFENNEVIDSGLFSTIDSDFVPLGSDGAVSFYTNISDYLATTLTIISLILILVACCMFVWKLIKVVGRLFMGA